LTTNVHRSPLRLRHLRSSPRSPFLSTPPVREAPATERPGQECLGGLTELYDPFRASARGPSDAGAGGGPLVLSEVLGQTQWLAWRQTRSSESSSATVAQHRNERRRRGVARTTTLSFVLRSLPWGGRLAALSSPTPPETVSGDPNDAALCCSFVAPARPFDQNRRPARAPSLLSP
jgi:hypothetical protein